MADSKDDLSKRAAKENREEEVFDKQHQNHCDKCISPVRCLKYRALHKNDPNFGVITCPIISCPHKCGWQYHECKKNEHELLCARAKVNCINKQYGCPLVMERSHRANHLPSCPARY